MNNITYDNRDDLTRPVAGDLVATSGELGSGLNLWGLSYTKLYRINPYFIKQPTPDIRGFVTLPSDYEMTMYYDERRITFHTGRDGEFFIENYEQPAGPCSIPKKRPDAASTKVMAGGLRARHLQGLV